MFLRVWACLAIGPFGRTLNKHDVICLSHLYKTDLWEKRYGHFIRCFSFKRLGKSESDKKFHNSFFLCGSICKTHEIVCISRV